MNRVAITLVDPEIAGVYSDLVDLIEGEPQLEFFESYELWPRLADIFRKGRVQGENRVAYEKIRTKMRDDQEDESDEGCDCPKCTYHRWGYHRDEFDATKYCRWALGELEAAAWVTYRKGLEWLRAAS